MNDDVLAYFTNVERLRDELRQAIIEHHSDGRIWLIHGDPLSGKSSLLKKIEQDCADLRKGGAQVVSARATFDATTGDPVRSAIDALSEWEASLTREGLHLHRFVETHERIQSVATKAHNDPGAAHVVATLVTLGVLSLGTLAIPLNLPVGQVAIAPLGGIALLGLGARDILSRFFSRADTDLILEESERENQFTNLFLSDLRSQDASRTVVLMVEPYEQLGPIQQWLEKFATELAGLHRRVLLVIAGRELPNWDRHPPLGMKGVNRRRIEPMGHRDMQTLAQRYYNYLRLQREALDDSHTSTTDSEPLAPQQLATLIKLAQGTPGLLTGAVRSWMGNGIADISAGSRLAIDHVLSKLTNERPNGLALAKTVKALSVVRWFNVELFEELIGVVLPNTPRQDVAELYDQVKFLPFVREHQRGKTIEPDVRATLYELASIEMPGTVTDLHKQAASYFETRAAVAATTDIFAYRRELLFHCMRGNEGNGIDLFRRMAEQMVCYRLLNQLRILIRELDDYQFQKPTARLWRDYYRARLNHLESDSPDIENVYQQIADNLDADTQLRAYALCDLGSFRNKPERLTTPRGVAQAEANLRESLERADVVDAKLVEAYSHLRGVYIHVGKWKEAIDVLDQEIAYLQREGDVYSRVSAYAVLKGTYGLLGDWAQALRAEQLGTGLLKGLPDSDPIRTRLDEEAFWVHLWSGHYATAEAATKSVLRYATATEDNRRIAQASRDLGFALCMQDRFSEAQTHFEVASRLYREEKLEERGGLNGFWGAFFIRRQGPGDLDRAEDLLTASKTEKLELNDNIGVPELDNWLGLLYELRGDQTSAESAYHRTIEQSWGRRYFEVGALAGLARIQYLRKDKDFCETAVRAEQLALTYGYNDYLSSLMLCRGHLAWEIEREPETALSYYKRALSHALLFNRFLLYEILSGQPQGSPLPPLIPYCLGKADIGTEMLQEIEKWWRTGPITPATAEDNVRSDPSQPEAPLAIEIRSRLHEPGDGTMPEEVVMQISKALH